MVIRISFSFVLLWWSIIWGRHRQAGHTGVQTVQLRDRWCTEHQTGGSVVNIELPPGSHVTPSLYLTPLWRGDIRVTMCWGQDCYLSPPSDLFCVEVSLSDGESSGVGVMLVLVVTVTWLCSHLTRWSALWSPLWTLDFISSTNIISSFQLQGMVSV